MPQASAFTNSVRAYSEGRNTKPQFPGNILNIDNLRALSCDLIPVPPPPSEPYVVLEFYNNNTQLKVSWYNIVPVQNIKVQIRDNTGVFVYPETGSPDVIITSDINYIITTGRIDLSGLYWIAYLTLQITASQIDSDPLYNITSPPGGGI